VLLRVSQFDVLRGVYLSVFERQHCAGTGAAAAASSCWRATGIELMLPGRAAVEPTAGMPMLLCLQIPGD
jgi:hypothetical protein